jgi:hypothetical protein
MRSMSIRRKVSDQLFPELLVVFIYDLFIDAVNRLYVRMTGCYAIDVEGSDHVPSLRYRSHIQSL